jgi:HAD superfamily hydrolase (TIGR01484 family)
MKRLVIFDLDGTLAQSKSSLDGEMVELLGKLLQKTKVAIISGGDWPQFEKQILGQDWNPEFLKNLFLLPTCGTKFFRYIEGPPARWEKIYADDLTEIQKREIIEALEKTIESLGLSPLQVWGQVIEDRGSQITFSALGQEAPIQEKEKWDPDFVKRTKMQAMLLELIPEFSVRSGGTTSIDITRPGIDKAYGIAKLVEILKIGKSEMLFAGDAIFPGGNDYSVKETGVATIQVRGPEETKRVIEAIIAW